MENNQLGKMSGFVSGEQINYLPKFVFNEYLREAN